MLMNGHWKYFLSMRAVLAQLRSSGMHILSTKYLLLASFYLLIESATIYAGNGPLVFPVADVSLAVNPSVTGASGIC